MLMREQFVYGYVVASVAEMSGFARLLSCSSGAGDRSDVNLIIDETCGSQRQRCQLDRRSKTAGIRHVVSHADFLPRAFAQAIHEMPSGIISVEPEVIAQIYDPAIRTDLMTVHKLP